jgi:hypothetical protein
MSVSPEKDFKRLERAEHYIYLAAGYILVLPAAGLLALIIFLLAWPMRLQGGRNRNPSNRPYAVCADPVTDHT